MIQEVEEACAQPHMGHDWFEMSYGITSRRLVNNEHYDQGSPQPLLSDRYQAFMHVNINTLFW